MKSLKSLSILLFVLSLSVSCTKDDDMDAVINSSEAKITEFKINTVESVITGQTIAITLPNATDVSNLMAEVTISENATIDPDPTIATDYTNPKTFTVTAQDGVTQSTYTVNVTIATVTPTAENPYPEGVFILRSLLSQNYELDFRHTSGTVSSNVYQNANNGNTISGIEISDIIPHSKGYLLMGNMFDNSGGKIIYTNLKFEVLKEEVLEKCNVVGDNYARVGNKIYYTNISNLVEYNQPKNKTYVINTDTNTLVKFDNNQALQYYATSNGELYFTDVIRGFYKVTDLDSQTATDLSEDFDDYTNSFVMDNNDVLWSISRTRTPQNFGEAQSLNIGTFDYKLNLVAYDTNTGNRIESVSTENINRESNLYVANNKVYLITNQNTHFTNPEKKFQRLYIENNMIKLETVYNLPRTTSTNIFDMTYDGNMYKFGNNTLMVKGRANNTGYYYDIDLNSGTTSNKTTGTNRLFERNTL